MGSDLACTDMENLRRGNFLKNDLLVYRNTRKRCGIARGLISGSHHGKRGDI